MSVRAPTASSSKAAPVGAHRAHPDAREVGDDVRGEVAARVVQLVQQLLLARRRGHRAAGAVDLGDDERAIGLDLGDRKAEPRQRRHIFVPGVGEVAAGDLAGALEQVPGDGDPAEHRPVVHREPELVDDRRREQRRIRDAAGDHDVGAARQRLDDRRGAEVGARGHQAVAERRRGRAELVEHELPGAHACQHVVPGDRGDAQRPQAGPARDLGHLGGGRHRVRRAHVGDDLDALRGADRQHGLHALLEQRVVALRWVGHARLLRDRDRALGEALEREVLDVAARGELDGWLDAIPGIASS